MISVIDDITLKKKTMHSGHWGLSRETIGLLDIRQINLYNTIMHFKKTRMRYHLLIYVGSSTSCLMMKDFY